MKKTLALLGVVGFVMSILATGCETTKGAGRDLEGAGESIQRTANDVQH
jgi:predicted small secreted protein